MQQLKEYMAEWFEWFDKVEKKLAKEVEGCFQRDLVVIDNETDIYWNVKTLEPISDLVNSDKLVHIDHLREDVWDHYDYSYPDRIKPTDPFLASVYECASELVSETFDDHYQELFTLIYG